MSVAVAHYLRHLATRCSRMSRDCTDPVVSKELVIISVELVEKAEILEAEQALLDPDPDPNESQSDVVCTDCDDSKS
jgi:hypothetical protein